MIKADILPIEYELNYLDEIGEKKFIEKVKRSSLKEIGKVNYRNNIKSISTSKPFVNIGFDTEDDSKGNVHLLIYYVNKKYYVFDNKFKALYWLLFSDFNYDVIVWCVNTEYDLNNLVYPFNYIIDRLYAKSRFILGKPFFTNRIKFYDLMNFYTGSARDIGKLHGLKKHEFDFKRKYDKYDKLIISQKEINYCKQDTKIAQVAGEFITNKYKEFDIRQSATAPSCSLQIYAKHYSPINLFSYNKNNYILKKDDLKTLQDSYCGGRVEAFFIGKYKGNNIKYYDINSLYPYVMKNYLYPNPFSPVKVFKSKNINNGVIDCLIDIPVDNYIGLLPVRYDRLTFPVGNVRGVFTLPEIINAENNGCRILKVFKSIEYANVVDLFSEYIDDFYEKRLKSKTKADNNFNKLTMNSLYGKFAERNIIIHYKHISENTEPYKQIINDYAVIEESLPAFHNNVVIASYVTSYARYELYKYLRYIYDNGGILLYCDTDSVIYDGKFDLPVGKNLGQMKLEDKLKWINILGNKMYCYENKSGDLHHVFKGVPKHLQKDMFEKGVVYYKKPIRYMESKRRKNKNYIPNYWIDFEKKHLTKYKKRNILKSGFTEPITIGL